MSLEILRHRFVMGHLDSGEQSNHISPCIFEAINLYQDAKYSFWSGILSLARNAQFGAKFQLGIRNRRRILAIWRWAQPGADTSRTRLLVPHNYQLPATSMEGENSSALLAIRKG